MSRRILAVLAILIGMALLAPAAADASELSQRGGNHPGVGVGHHGGHNWGGHVGGGFRHPWGFRGPVVVGVGLPFIPPPVAFPVPVAVPAPVAAPYAVPVPVSVPYAPPQVNYAPALAAPSCGCPGQ